MPFTVADLLLTPEREAQLTAALANAGHATPLADLLAEAEARLDALLAGRQVSDAQRAHIVRALTLRTAYALVGPVPKDIEALYQDALSLLAQLRGTAAPDPPLAGWGSEPRISPR